MKIISFFILIIIILLTYKMSIDYMIYMMDRRRETINHYLNDYMTRKKSDIKTILDDITTKYNNWLYFSQLE